MRAKIVRKEILNRDTFSLWLQCERVVEEANPGQFIQVRVGDGFYPFLSRPFSIADIDPSKNALRIAFKVRGEGTSLLSKKGVGEFLEILGPLGKPCPIPEGGKTLLVGGGIGAAPLLFLTRVIGRVREKRPDFILGAKTKRELVLLREIEALSNHLEIATEDGSYGKEGLVTDLLEGKRYNTIFACGPLEMLKRIKEMNLPSEIYGFFETRMGCGTGLCFSCAIKKRGGGYLRVCRDGPVFNLEEIDFES